MNILKRKFKKFLFTFLKRILSEGTASQVPEGFPKGIKRILVIRQDNRIGNLMFVTPLLQLLKEHIPDSEVHIAVGGSFPEVLQNNPFIDKVHCYDQLGFIRRPWRFIGFIHALRRMKFDAAIDCKRGFSFNNALILLLSQALVKIGFNIEETRTFLTYRVDEPEGRYHESQIMAHLAFPLTGERPIPPMAYYLSKDETARMGEYLNRFGLKEERFILGINPGGRGSKQWPAYNFRDITEQFLEKTEDTVVLVFLGPDEKKLKGLFEEIDNQRIVIVMPKDIRELGIIINCCSVFLANDTGPLHIAAALKKQCIALFTNSPLVRYGPPGKTNITIGWKNLNVEYVLTWILHARRNS
jgi:heptosyltransferase-2